MNSPRSDNVRNRSPLVPQRPGHWWGKEFCAGKSLPKQLCKLGAEKKRNKTCCEMVFTNSQWQSTSKIFKPENRDLITLQGINSTNWFFLRLFFVTNHKGWQWQASTSWIPSIQAWPVRAAPPWCRKRSDHRKLGKSTEQPCQKSAHFGESRLWTCESPAVAFLSMQSVWELPMSFLWWNSAKSQWHQWTKRHPLPSGSQTLLTVKSAVRIEKSFAKNLRSGGRYES